MKVIKQNAMWHDYVDLTYAIVDRIGYNMAILCTDGRYIQQTVIVDDHFETLVLHAITGYCLK